MFREYLASFVIASNSSLSIVENKSFQQLLQYCNGKVETISRRTLDRDIHTLYDTLFIQIMKCLQTHCSNGGKISLTLHAWSSST